MKKETCRTSFFICLFFGPTRPFWLKIAFFKIYFDVHKIDKKFQKCNFL